jgi:hypothetical protein
MYIISNTSSLLTLGLLRLLNKRLELYTYIFKDYYLVGTARVCASKI